MSRFLKVFSAVLVLLCSFTLTAHAQDFIPPKTSEGGELKPSSAGQYPELRMTPDKPEIVTLASDAANIIVGNNDHLAVTPDSARRLIFIPRLPGATYLKVLAEDGSVIMERYIVIAAPKKKENYVRIRRACVNGVEGCQEYSMYYCPDMCHKLGLVETESSPTQALQAAPSSGSNQNTQLPVQPADGTPAVSVQ